MKILIVDDSKFFSKIVRKELEKGGFEVDNRTDGFECIEYLKYNSVDLLVLDVIMPKMDGFETYEKILEIKQCKNLPVIFLTGSDKKEYREKGFALGATDFFRKEFQEGEFVNSINRILKKNKMFSGRTALVAEDSAPVRTLITRMLSEQGIKVLPVSDGEMAFKTYKKYKKYIDIVITDYHMPKITGTKLIEKIRKELGQKDIPIIVITSNTDTDSIIEFFNTGATDYMTKPFLKEEFLARVNSQLGNFYMKEKLKTNITKLKDLNSVKDKFLSVCSHDLRSPLSSIIGFSQVLTNDESLAPEHKHIAKTIFNSGNHLLNIINDLLDLQKIEGREEYSMEPVSLDSIISSSIKSMNGALNIKEQKIDYSSGLDKEDKITGNELALGRVFNNLLSNAIKFSKEGTSISINTKKTEANTLVEVKDKGIGIPEDKIDKIMDIYTKESSKGTAGEKGTGLGLSIVKEILEKHNADIKITSIVDEGTTFTITFNDNKSSKTKESNDDDCDVIIDL